MAGWARQAFPAGALLLAGCVGAMLLIGIASWRRTVRLRRGTLAVGPGAVGGGRTSRATLLPGVAGAALTVLSCDPAASGHWAGASLGLLAGSFVALTGLARRVTALEAGRTALMVRYAWGRAFAVPWDGCSDVRPPRAPWGGWRIRRSDGASRILMPSDLLGRERVLAVLIDRSALAFAGGRWTKRRLPTER